MARRDELFGIVVVSLAHTLFSMFFSFSSFQELPLETANSVAVGGRKLYLDAYAFIYMVSFIIPYGSHL